MRTLKVTLASSRQKRPHWIDEAIVLTDDMMDMLTGDCFDDEKLEQEIDSASVQKYIKNQTLLLRCLEIQSDILESARKSLNKKR